MWVSNSSDVPTVVYGVSTDDLSSTSTGTSATYSANMMCGPAANISRSRDGLDVVVDNSIYFLCSPNNGFINPGWMHSVVLTGAYLCVDVLLHSCHCHRNRACAGDAVLLQGIGPCAHCLVANSVAGRESSHGVLGCLLVCVGQASWS